MAGSAAAAHEDVHSTEVATDALLSVLPACLEAGRPAAEAVAAVVEAALRLPPHRRLPLLTSLHAALPQVISSQQALHRARHHSANGPWRRCTLTCDTDSAQRHMCRAMHDLDCVVIAGQRAAAGAAGAAAAGSRARAGGAACFPAGCHGGDGCSYTLRSRGGWAAAGAGSQPQQPGAAVTALRLGVERFAVQALEHTMVPWSTPSCAVSQL